MLVFILLGCTNSSDLTQPASTNSENAPGSIDEPSAQDIYMPSEVLIVLHDEFEPVDTVDYFKNFKLSVIRDKKYPWGTLHRMLINDGSTVESMCEQLKLLQSVKFAEPNYYLHFAEAPYIPNDPMWESDADPDDDPRSSIWEQWGPSKLGASIVWNESKGSEDVIVAIVDTGVRRTHEDLADSIWINEGEIQDDGIDNDNNGWIDDWWGWDTFEHNNNPFDPDGSNHYHGTGCAGVVAATQDNDVGISGIAPNVKIMAIRADMNDGPTCVDSVVEAWDYAKVNGADIISMSFYVIYPTDVLETAAFDTWDNGNGPIMMASAGNNNNTVVHVPAGYDCVICVSATVPFTVSGVPHDELRISRTWGGWWWGSSYGSHVNIAGYGERTYSTYGSGDDQYWDGVNHWFFNGTSCACPTAAGVMALIVSMHPGEEGQWYWDRIEETADDLHTPGFDIHTGFGRVNALRAVYGSDRYSDEEDADGFVTIDDSTGLLEPELFDSIHDFPSSPFHDTEDLFRIIPHYDGELIIDLDIFTWGENLDIALYSDHSMTTLIDESVIVNHADSSFENITLMVDASTEYYLSVYSPAAGNSTTYGLDINYNYNTLTVTGDPINPVSANSGQDEVELLRLNFDITYNATLDTLVINLNSDGADNWAGFQLYRDSNFDGIFNFVDTLIASEPFIGGNQCTFSGLSQYWDSSQIMQLFVIADINDNVPENSSVFISLESESDITVEETVKYDTTGFPIESGPVLIVQ